MDQLSYGLQSHVVEYRELGFGVCRNFNRRCVYVIIIINNC